MRNPFRRPAPPVEGDLITSTAEAEIAVGSLTGVAPSRILQFAVVVMDDLERVRVTFSGPRAELDTLLGAALLECRDEATS